MSDDSNCPWEPRNWKPTLALRWSVAGVLQQQWYKSVGEWSDRYQRSFYHYEYEWRDVPREGQ